MENGKSGDVAARVLTRMAHKRDQFGQFCTKLSSEQWQVFLSQFRDYLMEVIKNLQNVEKVNLNY